jgi:subtilisin family serine protease
VPVVGGRLVPIAAAWIVVGLLSPALPSANAMPRVPEVGQGSLGGRARLAPARVAPHEVLVRFRPGVSRASATRLVREIGARPVAIWGSPSIHVVRLRPGVSVGSALRDLRRSGSVARAEPNVLFDLDSMVPDDPLLVEQWGLHNTGQEHPVTDPPPDRVGGTPGADGRVTDAWATTAGSADVVIAIIDTGADLTNPDLRDRLWVNPGETANGVDDDGNGLVDDVHGYDFYDGDGDPQDHNGHGTFVAGVAAATAGNGIGVAGVCPECRIMVLRAGNDQVSSRAVLESVA